MKKRIHWTCSTLLAVVLLTTLVCAVRADHPEPPLLPGASEASYRNGAAEQVGAPSTPRRRWSWQRGGSFQALDVSGGAWFGGELLVQGLKSPNESWTWTQMAPELTDRRSIIALDFYDADHGCALGSDDTVLYTESSGYYWFVRALPAGVSELTAVHMTGPERIYAVGRNADLNPRGVVLYSDDGGESWTTLYTTTWEAWLTDLVFFPDGHGFAIGYDWTQIANYTGLILAVDGEGGSEVFTQHRLFMRAVSAPDEDHIYVVASDEDPINEPPVGTVLYSHNAGDSWYSVPLPADGASVQPYDIFFPAASQGWVVGTAGEEGLLFKGTGSGVTWSLHENFAQRAEHLSSLDLIGGLNGGGTLFAVQSAGDNAFPCNGGCPGVVVQSTDGGETWQRLEILSGVWSQALALNPAATAAYQGLILGRFGDDDSYLPYSPQRYPAALPLRAEGWPAPLAMEANVADGFVDWRGLDLGSEYHGWASADHTLNEGKIWHTENMGLTWVQQTAPFFSSGGDLSAVDSLRAWAVDYVLEGYPNWYYASRLLSTSDGGASWEEVDLPVLAYYALDADRDARVSMVDQDHGCVLSESTAAVKCTSDGWSTHASHTLGCWGLDVAMLDQQRGWTLCYDLVEDVFEVWSTSDGGDTWTLTSGIDPADVSQDEDTYTLYGYGSALSFSNAARGWFAHHNLWGTEDGGASWYRVSDGIHPELGISLLDTTGDTGCAATPGGTLLALAPLQVQLALGQMGGELRAPDGGPFVVQFPAGAVLTDTLASLVAYEPGSAGEYFASSVYELSLPSGVELAAPITLTTVVTPAVGLTQASADGQTPLLARWEAGSWQPLADSTYAPDGRLTATTQETGFFGVVVRRERAYLPIVLSGSLAKYSGYNTLQD
jgi:photosystem II stability/assembly factor-like uncharacterized protein